MVVVETLSKTGRRRNLFDNAVVILLSARSTTALEDVVENVRVQEVSSSSSSSTKVWGRHIGERERENTRNEEKPKKTRRRPHYARDATARVALFREKRADEERKRPF